MGGYDMTRENDIRNAAWEYFQDLDTHHFYLLPHCNSQTDAFESGAKWADEHPYLSEEEQVGIGGLGMMWQKKHLIDKACSYLYAKSSMSGSEINSFKKAMEEVE